MMSLYSQEEVCLGCKNAVFHECCHKFCSCNMDKEDECNYCNSTCPFHSDPTHRVSKDIEDDDYYEGDKPEQEDK